MGGLWSYAYDNVFGEDNQKLLVTFIEDSLKGFIDNCCISEFRDFNDKSTILEHPCCVVVVSSNHYRQTLHLNKNHPIAPKLTQLLQNQDSGNNKQILTDFVRILFELCTWPDRRLRKMNKLYFAIHYSSVVCGPQRLYLSRVYINDHDEEEHVQLPKIVYLNPNKTMPFGVETMALRHQEFDACLMDELDDYNQSSCKENINLGNAMVMYSPMFYLLQNDRFGVNDIINEFVKKDKLFGLSLFFGNCLIDRTGILNQTTAIKLTVLDQIPHLEDHKTFKKDLSQIMVERATMIFDLAQQRKIECIDIYWSGGIDSTALLCALFMICEKHKEYYKTLLVKISQQSRDEYPWFYEHVLLPMKNKCGVQLDEIIANKSITQQLNTNHLSITGELGDQLFGSALLVKGFKTEMDEKEDAQYIYVRRIQNRFLNSLHVSWKKTLALSLQDVGIIDAEKGDEAIQEWIKWIQPQLDQSPIEIVSTYDILWWLNYSCKWQHVSLRLFHGLSGMNQINKTCLQNVIHFYQYDQFELWSLNPLNHKRKFPDLTKWTTYKEPLKKFILNYTKDEPYYHQKEKIGSLCQVDESGTHMLGIDNHFNIISYGKHSISQLKREKKYNNQIAQKLFQ
eukprot:10295_1